MKKFWKGIKYYSFEFLKIYSEEKSFFSKKRLESGFSFFVGQIGMIFFLVKNITSLDATDFAWWAAIEFTVSGYMVSQIQREKKSWKNPNYNNEYDNDDDSYNDYKDEDNYSHEDEHDETKNKRERKRKSRSEDNDKLKYEI